MENIIPIQSGDIHIWVAHPLSIKDPTLLNEYKNWLTDEEVTRQQRYRFEKDQHDALITRAFVRDLLSQYAQKARDSWRFEKGEKDKPEIIDPPIPLRFNLSHTQGLIVCAVTLHDDIGIDVEYVDRNNDILNIADRYFSPVEVEELFSLPESQQRSRFFDYWTLKESYIKACGLGLAIPLDHFSFHIGQATQKAINPDIGISFVPERNDQPELWTSWIFYPNEIHRISLSIKSERKEPFKLSFFESIPAVSCKPLELPFKSVV